MQDPILIVLLGPTVSGKSALAVELAKKFGGEIISADSRQVYRGLDIGTGKITKREMRGIPHHLLDIADPKRQFSVAEYKQRADAVIRDIHKRGKIPFLVGGTGLYIDAVARGFAFPAVPPNSKLRKLLEKKEIPELLKMLGRLDSGRSKTVDRLNPRRIIRAIEIARAIGKVPPLGEKVRCRVLWIGITLPPATLKQKIRHRLHRRMKAGMTAEARRLRKKLAWKRFYELGLEYRYLADYLRKQISREEMLQQLEKAIVHYAKRQLTWFKRRGDTHWIKTRREAEQLVASFKNPK